MQVIQIRQGDSFVRLKTFPEGSVGALVSDPPYLIGFMNKDWDKAPDIESDDGEEEGTAATAEEIHESQAWHEAWLKEVFRVLKPGGIAKVFAATRTMHRLAAAMESVGFILEPDSSTEAWVYGSGFPKSHNVSKSLDRHFGKSAEREVIGYKQGVGGENMNDIVKGRDVIRSTDDVGGKGVGAYGTGAKQVAITIPVTAPATEEAKKWEGYGTALKPAWEPFVVGRKPC